MLAAGSSRCAYVPGLLERFAMMILLPPVGRRVAFGTPAHKQKPGAGLADTAPATATLYELATRRTNLVVHVPTAEHAAKSPRIFVAPNPHPACAANLHRDRPGVLMRHPNKIWSIE